MNREAEPLQSDVDEVLTAYLDDELSPAEREEVEARLSRDVEFRRQLSQMQRAWDLLDALPREELSFDFTKTTLELVATRAAEEVREESSPEKRSWGFVFAMIGVLVFAVAGYGIVYTLLDAPNRRLTSDLPILENLDEYRHAESIEFLEMLDEADLFEEEEATPDESI